MSTVRSSMFNVHSNVERQGQHKDCKILVGVKRLSAANAESRMLQWLQSGVPIGGRDRAAEHKAT